MMRWSQTGIQKTRWEKQSTDRRSDRKICPLPGCGRRVPQAIVFTGRKDMQAFIQKARKVRRQNHHNSAGGWIQKLAITNKQRTSTWTWGLALLNSPDAMEDGDFIELSGKYQGKFEEFYPDMDELKRLSSIFL